MVHVNLYTGEKHEVENADLSEQLKAHISGKKPESVGTYGDTCQYKPDDMWNLEPVEQ